MSPARFRWGILLILVGVLLLLNETGVVYWWFWRDMWILFPVLLIAIGVEKIFTKSKLEFIAYLAPVALAGFIIWTAVDQGGGSRPGSRFGRHQEYSYPKDDHVTSLKADLNLDDDNLVLKGTADYMLLARYDGTSGRPTVDYNVSGGSARVSIKARDRWFWLGDRDERLNDLEVYLSDQIPVSLKCSGDQSQIRLDLSQLKVSDLDLNSEQGRVRVIVGKLLDKIKMALEGEEADIKLQFPSGSGIRLTGADSELAHYLDRLGLTKNGDVYISNGYDTLKPQIEIELKSNLSQLAVDYY